MYENHLVYGNDETEQIVALEVKDDIVYAYFNNGVLKTQPAKYFMLSSRMYDKQFRKLEGDSFFKYTKIFDDLDKYKEYRKKMWRYKDNIWTALNPTEMHMLTRGTTLFKGLKIEDVSRLGFDIESSGLVQDKNSIVYMISNTFRDGKGNESKRVFRLDEYNNCGEMLTDWCNYVREIDPTLMVAHNGIGYDLPYMNFVADKYGIQLNLGRDESEMTFAKRPRNYRVDGSQSWEYKDVKIFGRHVIDTMFLSVKYDFGRNFPSWGLKPIIEHMGLVKEERQFYDASKIKDNWDNLEEREKIVQYGVDDGDDCLNLYEIMAPSFFYLTQSIPKTFQTIINSASGSWLNNIFVRAYLQDFKSIPKATPADRFEGAISYGVPGVYSNCFKQDVASLYPSIMRQYNIYDKAKDPEAYFPTIVEHYTLERLKNKKIAADTKDPYYKALEQSQKIVINSLYGFMGANGLNFNSPENAALVTEYGRKILSQAMTWATGHDIDYWKSDERNNNNDLILVNCDTDSIMVTKKNGEFWSEDEREKFMIEMNNQFDDLIIWERDGYFERVVVIKSKNYVLLEEGSQKIKYKGSSLKDSKKEPALKEMLLTTCESLIHNTRRAEDVYNDYLVEISSINDINRWCTKKSITEKLMEANDTAKKKVLKAIEDIDYSIGDKVYLFNDIDGRIQKVVKGELVFLKSGEAKIIDNNIYRLAKDFTGSYDKKHYLKRIYNTMSILQTVIDMDQIINYSLSKNFKQFKEIYE